MTSSTHAEIGAINKYKLEYPGCSLVNCKLMVIRGNFLGKFTMSKPCIECYHSILESGIKTVIYSSGHQTYDKMKL